MVSPQELGPSRLYHTKSRSLGIGEATANILKIEVSDGIIARSLALAQGMGGVASDKASRVGAHQLVL